MIAYLWCRYLSRINATPEIQDWCDLFKKIPILECNTLCYVSNLLPKSIQCPNCDPGDMHDIFYNRIDLNFYILNAPFIWNLMPTLAKCSEFPDLKIFRISDIPNFLFYDFTIFHFCNFPISQISDFQIFQFQNVRFFKFPIFRT